MMQTYKLQIEYVPIDTVFPDPLNPRKHSKSQIALLAKSIQSLGANSAIFIDSKNMILAGHCRHAAYKMNGMAEIPIIKLPHLTEAQAKAFALADNKMAEHSTTDQELLGEAFKELGLLDLDFSLQDTGYSWREIDIALESLELSLGGPDPDDQAPALSKGPTVSQLGSLWLMGKNRLLCGDATKPEDVARLMDGELAAMTFTDPPYSVNYANSAKDKLRGKNRPILNDNLGDRFYEFLHASCANILSVTKGATYIAMSSSELHTLQKAFMDAGGHWSTFIIWAKNTFTLGRADYQRQFEPILYGWPKGKERYWCGARDQGDVWHFNKPLKNDLHPTMKPVELVMLAIKNSSIRGDIVFDAFLGSGTTLIAAERSGRICYGLELDPAYADVIVQRWQQHTGQQAVHAGTGKTFNQMLSEMGVFDA